MKLNELIGQIQRSSNDPNGDEHLIGTVLQYLNEEIEYVSVEFPEMATSTITTTSQGNYFNVNTAVGPSIKIREVMVNNVGATKKHWKEMREGIGNAI